MRTEPNDPTQTGPALSAATKAIRLTSSEVAALGSKAARGAGMDWGLAEEAGFAAGWLQGRGLDGAAALLAHLDGATGGPWPALRPVIAAGHWRPVGAGRLCPIILGATLGDFCDLPEARMTDGGLRLGPVAVPLLLLPFLAQIASRWGRPLRLDWQGGAVTVDGRGGLSGDLSALAALAEASLQLSHSAAHPALPRSAAPPACAPDTLLGLDRLAMQTTVPPSQRSRADAGAGSDND